MDIINLIPIIFMSMFGGLVSRMCGGGRPALPWKSDQIIFAAPYAFVFAGLSFHWPMVCAALVAFVTAFAGKLTGHGQYIGLGHTPRANFGDIARLDPIVALFFGADTFQNNYWRCFFGLMVTGMAVTLCAGILYGALVSPLGGAIIAVSGAFKAVAYAAGWFTTDHLNPHAKPTLIGECLTGVFAWGAIACLLF